MCESNAYLQKDGKEELLLENVTFLRPKDGKIVIKSLFGDEKEIDGNIVEIDLMSHRIVFEAK